MTDCETEPPSDAVEAERLRLLLEQERSFCARLRPLLERERAAAASCDVPRILECVRERESLQLAWQRVAGSRRAQLARIGSRLDQLAANDRSLATTLSSVRQEVAVIAREQAINDGVVRSALSLVGDVLSTLQGAVPSSRYDRSAAVSAGLPRSFHSGWRA